MEPEPVKSSLKSGEFWLASLFAAIVSALVAFGIINKDDQQTVAEAVSMAAQSIAGFIVAATAIWKIIQSRTEVKTAHSKAVVAVAEEKASENLLTAAERRKHA